MSVSSSDLAARLIAVEQLIVMLSAQTFHALPSAERRSKIDQWGNFGVQKLLDRESEIRDENDAKIMKKAAAQLSVLFDEIKNAS